VASHVVDQTRWMRTTGYLRRDWLLTVAIAVVGAICLLAILAPWLAPYPPNLVNLAIANTGPSSSHLLGTDSLGRDILSRLIWGSRTALLGPVLVIALSTLVGAVIALACAWRGGMFDSVLSRAMDIVFAFPGLLLALLAVGVFGPGLLPAAVALGIAYTPYMVRVVRGAALRERAQPYIAACSVQGFSGISITRKHLLPNLAPLILAQATVGFGYALIDLAAVSFLGLGVQPPTSDWGSMINAGEASLLGGHPQESLSAGIAIVITVVAVNFVGGRVFRVSDSSGR
jgi:peptide/nickel transport system permease protein